MPRGLVYPVHLAAKVSGDPRSFVPTLRSIAASVDPALRLHRVMPLDEVVNDELRFYSFWVRITIAVSGIALLLSLAGIYAVMSFTVSRRTREIGVRVALGAEPRRIMSAIFRRPLRQVAIGVAIGAVIVALLMDNFVTLRQIGFVAVYAFLVMGVCLLACIVPRRRALRVQPTEALRDDA